MRRNFDSGLSESKVYDSFRSARADEDLKDLKKDMTRLNTIVFAMWEVLKENGIGVEKLHAKIDHIVGSYPTVSRPTYKPVIVKCPRCGKSIQESRAEPLVGRCMYCGDKVVFYPYSEQTSLTEPADPNASSTPGAEGLF